LVIGTRSFIKKVHLDTLYGRWRVQWGAKDALLRTSAYAFGCKVHKGDVDVAGTAKDSAGMVQGQKVFESVGGDDICVAQLDRKEDGIMNWMQQVGSLGDNHLA
jgi:hypothetical protein